MKKKVLFLAVLLITALCARAQLLDGVEVGGGVHYAQQDDSGNVGLDIIATKSVAEWARLRMVAAVNGFVPNFDRYGVAMCGASVEAGPVYAFADFGLSWNPSAKPPAVGMAFDGGVGIKVNVAKSVKVYSELGVDRVGHGDRWRSTAAVKAGVLWCR